MSRSALSQSRVFRSALSLAGVALLLLADSALAHFQRAAQLSPQYAPLDFNIGVTYERLGKPAEAKVAYRAFLARAPRRMTALIRHAEERLAAP